MTDACHARRMPRRSLALLLLLALGGWEPLRSPDPDVQAGNRAYAEGRYDDALEAYDRVARRGGVDPHGLAFDRGTALLKKAQATKDAAERAKLMARAVEDLKEAAKSSDPRLRADAHYNRGNASLGEDSIEKLGEAIEAYKDALRASPDHDNARLAVKGRHFFRLGEDELRIPAGDVNETLLEEFAKMLIGQPSVLRKYRVAAL